MFNSRSFVLVGVMVLFLSALSGLARGAPILTGGLSLWLDADDVSTFTFSSGNMVQAWNDKSGNGENVSNPTTSQQPLRVAGVLNDRPVVRFDGTDDRLFRASSNALNATSHTIFMVMNLNFALEEPLGYGASGSTSRFVFTDTDGLHLYGGGAAGNLVNNNYVAGHYVIFYGLIQPGANASVNFIWDLNANTANAVNGTFSGTTAGSNRLDIGDYFLNAGNISEFFHGDIAEILIYNSALSPDDIQQNVDYLANKWVPEPASTITVVFSSMIGMFRPRRRHA